MSKQNFPWRPSGSLSIAGMDEAGRGALAGPVVAGACLISCDLFHRRAPLPCWAPDRRMNEILITDSKQLTPDQREHAYAWIISRCAWGIGIIGADVIDAKGILRATELAMRSALDDLRSQSTVDHLLVDGRDRFTFDCPHSSLVRGDALDPCIAAGSIIAKVTRDRLMIGLAERYPLYGFELHKGYGSEEHTRIIRERGPCEIHRRSFLTKILTEQLSFLASSTSTATRRSAATGA
ncbi:MAG: RNase HII [Candidatus Peregrinibacteria bacterium Greene0416_19]|nr:MAG: RNase HII [Candidatus Peregrinibacteria bacterium Greene0416_19]